MQLHNEIQVIVKLKYSNYQALQFKKKTKQTAKFLKM